MQWRRNDASTEELRGRKATYSTSFGEEGGGGTDAALVDESTIGGETVLEGVEFPARVTQLIAKRRCQLAVVVVRE